MGGVSERGACEAGERLDAEHQSRRKDDEADRERDDVGAPVAPRDEELGALGEDLE